MSVEVGVLTNQIVISKELAEAASVRDDFRQKIDDAVAKLVTTSLPLNYGFMVKISAHLLDRNGFEVDGYFASLDDTQDKYVAALRTVSDGWWYCPVCSERLTTNFTDLPVKSALDAHVKQHGTAAYQKAGKWPIDDKTKNENEVEGAPV